MLEQTSSLFPARNMPDEAGNNQSAPLHVIRVEEIHTSTPQHSPDPSRWIVRASASCAEPVTVLRVIWIYCIKELSRDYDTSQSWEAKR